MMEWLSAMYRLRVQYILVMVVLLCATLTPRISSANDKLGDLPQRALFVGNSLIYVGNVPAVFKSISEANGRSIEVDMLAQPGASLAERLQDGTVAKALKESLYSTLILQERGADLMCGREDNGCNEARAALAELVKLGQAAGAKVYLLGTYQPNPLSSKMLVDMELSSAQTVGATYIEVSESFANLRRLLPEYDWFSKDGSMHPGADLALLDAALVYKAVYGRLPTPYEIEVLGPIYTVKKGPRLELNSAREASIDSSIDLAQHYAKNRLESILRYLR